MNSDYKFEQTEKGIILVEKHKYNDDIVKIKRDVTDQILYLDIEEDVQGYIYPTLKALMKDFKLKSFNFISASIINAKAKQFDDGLYAAIEIARQKGTEKFPGKSSLLSAIYKALKEFGPGENIEDCLTFIFTASSLAGDLLDDKTSILELSESIKNRFLKDPGKSKPTGFYTWTRELEEIFRQSRFLQEQLKYPEEIAMAIIKAEKEDSYRQNMELTEQLTNPFSKDKKDLRELIHKISAGEKFDGEGNFTLFPPCRSHEGQLAEKLYVNGDISQNLMDKFIDELKAGNLDLTPRDDSGWYDYQTYSLEPLVRPEDFPEAEKLKFSEIYKESLLELFKSTFALMRETNIKDFFTSLCLPDLEIYPVLSIEPLVSYYLRRALSYNFLQRILVDFFGEKELKKINILKVNGKSEKNLYDELNYMETFFYGAAMLSALEIGCRVDLPLQYRPAADKEKAIQIVKDWIKTLHNDQAIMEDNRMMVPVFYDIEKDLMKVWVFLGYETKTLLVKFHQKPRITVLDRNGKDITACFIITEEALKKLEDKIDIKKLKSFIDKKFLEKELTEKLIELHFDEEEIELVLNHADITGYGRLRQGFTVLKNGKNSFAGIDFEEKKHLLICPVFAELYVKDILNRKEFQNFCDKYPTKNEIIDAFIQEIGVSEDFPIVCSELIFIVGGTFQMGSDREGVDDEKPVHPVTVDSFYMSKYPVTNREYKLFKPGHKGRWSEQPDYPVETVSWHDAVEYCNWLSDKEGLKRCYSGSGDNTVCDFTKNGYRLPTEAEWEYACRAGTTTEYYWGNRMNDDYCWYYNNSGNQIHPVGQKKPNQFGLYDMSGNVREWCWDWYDNYSKSPSKNPAGPSSGSYRIIRGGRWDGEEVSCRSASRHYNWPVSAYDDLGFRPVRRP